MGTVLILGNGFDLDLGWKTRYSDFTNSDFWPKESVDCSGSLLQFLNRKKHTADWFDLEQYLLDFCNELQREDVYHKDEYERENKHFFNELQVELGKYLEKEQENKIKSGSCAALLLKQLLSEDSKIELIYSFNYTDLYGICQKLKIKLSENVDYIHVHGSLKNKDLILGVDDSKVPDNYVFLQKTINIHYKSTNIIASMALAEEVIVFGHSFGKVDEEYFRPYFEYILRQDIVDGQCHPKIIIFTYDEESRIAILRRIFEMGINRQRLFNLCDFKIFRTKEDQKEIISYIERRKMSLQENI